MVLGLANADADVITLDNVDWFYGIWPVCRGCEDGFMGFGFADADADADVVTAGRVEKFSWPFLIEVDLRMILEGIDF